MNATKVLVFVAVLAILSPALVAHISLGHWGAVAVWLVGAVIATDLAVG